MSGGPESSGWQTHHPQPPVYPLQVEHLLVDAVAVLRAAAVALPADPVLQVAARRTAADLELLAPVLHRLLVEQIVARSVTRRGDA